MPLPTQEDIETANSTIEYLLGGGATSLVVGVFLVFDKFIKPKFELFSKKMTDIEEKQGMINSSIKAFEEYIREDRQAFIEFSKEYSDFKGHTEEAIKRVDNAESRIDDYIVESKAQVNSLTERFGDIKTGYNIQEGRIADLEKNERKHYEELKDMHSDNRILDKEMSYLRNDISEIKDTLRALTSSFNDLREQLLKIATK